MSEGKTHINQTNSAIIPGTHTQNVGVFFLCVCVCVVEVNRNKVFKTTRVRTLLKKDGCWIQSQKSNKEKEGAR